MKVWYTRIIAVLFTLSLLASPQMAVLATNDAQDVVTQVTPDGGGSQPTSEEPVVGNSEDGQPQDPATDPVGDNGSDSESGGTVETGAGISDSEETAVPSDETGSGDPEDSTDDATPDAPAKDTGDEGDTDTESKDDEAGPMSRSSGVGIHAVIDDGLYFYDVTWNDETGQATLNLEFEAGFAADAGDTFVINYASDTLKLAATQPVIPGLPVTISVNSAAESITLTFTEDYSVSEASAFPLVLNGEVEIPACRPSDGEQINGAYIEFWSSMSYASTFVQGENCPAAQHPAIEWVDFMPEMDAVVIDLYIPSDQIEPGFVATITYEQDKINIPNGTTTEFYIGGPVALNPVSVATAVANDGLITITFHDFEYDDEIYSRTFTGMLGATLEPVACVDVTEKDITDIGRLYFVASPGGTFVSYGINVALCNAAPATKTGVLSEDGTEVYWTIDSGDLINGGFLQDGFLITGQQFDCESIEVQLISPSSQGGYDVDCGWDDERYVSDFAVYFGGEGPVRAIVSVTGIVDQELSFGSVLNCATVSAGGREMPTALSTRDNNAGWGTTVCAEVRTAGVGDSISNTVSSPTIYQGETLTYTVNFQTTTGLWLTMSLDDVLPQGFEVTSVECTFDPAELAEGPCEIDPETNSLTVGLSRFIDMETGPDLSEGGQITLVIQGTVTAGPGTELVSQACGVRAIEIPGMPPFFSQIGSGTMCASTSTMVLQVPGETPTPSPTPDPAITPTPDPTGTVTPGETPTATTEPTDPVVPATPGASPTETGVPGEDDPTATSAVTGLPSAGQGSGAGASLLLAAMAACLLMAAAVGIRVRSPRG